MDLESHKIKMQEFDWENNTLKDYCIETKCSTSFAIKWTNKLNIKRSRRQRNVNILRDKNGRFTTSISLTENNNKQNIQPKSKQNTQNIKPKSKQNENENQTIKLQLFSKYKHYLKNIEEEDREILDNPSTALHDYTDIIKKYIPSTVPSIKETLDKKFNEIEQNKKNHK